MARINFKEIGTMALGGAAGAAVSEFGSNAISDAFTKKNRTQGDAEFKTPADVEIWKKAYTWDVALGLGAFVASAFLLKGMGRTADNLVKGAGAYLLGRGLVDGVRDLAADDADKTYRGRSKDAGLVTAASMAMNFGGRSIPSSLAHARARAMQGPLTPGRRPTLL